MRTFFVTLNWNTTAYFQKLIETVAATTPEAYTWIVVENGSQPAERQALLDYCAERYRGAFGLFSTQREGWGKPGNGRMDCVVIRAAENLGCVLGHNLAFEMAAALADGTPYDLVMCDTDVEVYEQHWLARVIDWADNHAPIAVDAYHKVALPVPAENRVGIVGLEHAASETCAGAVFLDPSGNWYLHPGQTARREPVRAESVGLGMALLRWPTPQLRFDTGFKIYYKQDDDLCFQVRQTGREVWAYPIMMTHWGSRGIKENNWQVNGEVQDYPAFDQMKQTNQAYFARKWAWALRARRAHLADEQRHLDGMAEVMRAQQTGG